MQRKSLRNSGANNRASGTEGRFKPAYLKLDKEALSGKVKKALDTLGHCDLCPRNCGVDRTTGQRGFCKTLVRPVVSSHGPHFGEERPLTGIFAGKGGIASGGKGGVASGSGTIFFSNCNLGCVFCQNWSISQKAEDSEMSFEALASVMLELEDAGCHNINLVTPTHQMPAILKSIEIAVRKGLTLPIVYNCGGYESVEALSLLDGVVDIYMPDFKYWSSENAERYSFAKDYPEAAREALREMHRQTGDLVIEDGVAKRGLLMRHLVLPGGLEGTEHIVEFIAGEISKDTYINIMDQYYPCYKAFAHPPLDRGITTGEYEAAVDAAVRAGLRRISGVTVE